MGSKVELGTPLSPQHRPLRPWHRRTPTVRKPPAFFTELGPPTSVTAEVEQKEKDSMSAWSEDLRFAQQAGVAVDVRLFDGQHFQTGVVDVDEEGDPFGRIGRHLEMYRNAGRWPER